MRNKKPVTKEAALVRMADLCAHTEQCEVDIRQKLYRLGLPMMQANEILNYLKENRFVDDSRYAGCFARDKCRFSAWGKYKIKMALAAKRISSFDIDDALESIDEQEYLEALMRTARSKARMLDLHGDEARDNRIKLYRHILSRGFESALAQNAIKEILREGK